eukprot:4850292-Prymnesium_polylepis.2
MVYATASTTSDVPSVGTGGVGRVRVGCVRLSHLSVRGWAMQTSDRSNGYGALHAARAARALGWTPHRSEAACAPLH